MFKLLLSILQHIIYCIYFIEILTQLQVPAVFLNIIVNNTFHSTTRITTLNICFPQVVPVAPTVLHRHAPEKKVDVSNLATIPSKSSCLEMITTIKLGSCLAVSCNRGVFDETCLQRLVNVHKLRDVCAQVKEEIEWLDKDFNYPDPGSAVPKEDLHTFKQLLMDKPDGNCVWESDKTILASDLATVVGTRWLHYSILSGFVKLLQQENSRTCTFLLNDLLLMDNETLQKQVSKIVQTKPSSLTFISLVGKTTEVFLGSPKRKGCHWAMTCVDVVSNTWFYCDTLGWNPPSDLKKEINRVLDAIDNIHCLPKKPFKKYLNCHVPSSTNVYNQNCS